MEIHDGVGKRWASFDDTIEYLKSWQTRGKVTNHLSTDQTGATWQFGDPDLLSLQTVSSPRGEPRL